MGLLANYRTVLTIFVHNLKYDFTFHLITSLSGRNVSSKLWSPLNLSLSNFRLSNLLRNCWQEHRCEDIFVVLTNCRASNPILPLLESKELLRLNCSNTNDSLIFRGVRAILTTQSDFPDNLGSREKVYPKMVAADEKSLCVSVVVCLSFCLSREANLTSFGNRIHHFQSLSRENQYLCSISHPLEIRRILCLLKILTNLLDQWDSDGV